MDLEKLQQLAREATPGPWRWEETIYGESVRDVHNEPVFFAGSVGHENATLHISDEDARYIAAADPTTVLALIRVARAAAAWREVRRWQRMGPEKDLLEAVDALAALERT